MRKKEKKVFEKFGVAEKTQLGDVIDSGDLFYLKGKKTKNLCKKIQKHFSIKHCATMSSGTAAIHSAIGALELVPGKEVITSPITDMGTLIGILYQNLIPVFADVDSRTYNIHSESIREKISDSTAAIVVVHLAGNPARMDEILALAAEHDLPVIEDCAQAYGAKAKGKNVGTVGNIGCFSLNAFKHISSGDGGFIITNDKELYLRAHNFADKSYDRLDTGRRLTILAPCYRITELQSAVALAQFEKLEYIVSKRHELGSNFNAGIEGLEGIQSHHVKEGDYCSYWFTMIRIDEHLLCPREEFVAALKAEGVPASAGYIPRPIYMEPVFQEKSFFPGGRWPAEIMAGKQHDYIPGACPVAEKVLETAIRISINESQDLGQVNRWVEKFKEIHEFYISGD
ncbi:DegT/DnrJ/EryC1/StrS family aminotransferase [Candidatus Bathyarchaeota archaeon]|nr:DegT/DnrJ/EryC1/StrS family aminotransferase [Candidatus Bathyarchaeota archaeon]